MRIESRPCMYVAMALAVVCGCVRVIAQGQDELLTVAERSNFRATARHTEVVGLLDAISAAYPSAKRASLGTSVEGRDIPLLILADPPVSDGVSARKTAREQGKVIVFAIGNIHAGEVDGKEALPMLAREIVGTPNHRLLRDLIIVFAPIYNADGNEQVDRNNRPDQNGPEEGMGRRENAKGLDLNRDFIKVEATETAGLVRFLNEWDPHLFIDTHTTNGSYHRYALTYEGVKAPATDKALLEWSRDSFLPAIDLAFEMTTGKHAFWYGNFEGAFGDAPRGHTRWESYPAEGRYGTTYIGLRNRLSILTEAYSYSTYKDRVLATRDFVRCALEVTAANKDTIVRLTREADQRAKARDPVGGLVAITSKAAACDESVGVFGYEEVIENGRSRSTGVPKDHACELWNRFVPEKTVARPWAYVLREVPGAESITGKLTQHGIEVERIPRSIEARVESYRIIGAKSGSRVFQDHVIVRVSTETATKKVGIEKDDFIIPVGQRLGTLAVYLLEPECEDGLATWNYFDRWLTIGEELPLYRVMEPIDFGEIESP